MSIAIEEDHLALAETARRFTAQHCSPTVARAAMAGAATELPPFWDEAAKLGWLGLAVPEPLGGEGYGFAELVVVIEALGRAIAPGPVLPSVWAAAVLAAGLADPEGTSWGADVVADVAAGRVAGAVALQADLTVAPDRATVSGSIDPVLCGAVASFLVAPLAVPDGTGASVERWCVLRLHEAQVGAQVTVTALESLDPTRPLARIDVVDAPMLLLTELPPEHAREQVEALGVALAVAECAGVAAWCVDTAADYAKDRRQFGRPIGQFQAVKHRCADMLVHLEQVRAVAWDAAAALDASGTPGRGVGFSEEAALSASVAGAVALDATVDVAKDCIQVLGGIGFTWEHEAHLYLRRAVSLRQLFGGGSPWRQAAATAALAGVRRHLRLELPADADARREAFRESIGGTIDAIAALPKDQRRAALADAGLIVPHWSPPWGLDASAVEQVVIDEELRRAGVRVPHLAVGAWAAPTVAVHGTVEQQERWVRPTLHGDIAWCQLFSEPEAGSDLAALSTAAVRVEADPAQERPSGWSLNGQKVWTSMAKEADWGICLARTNPTAAKHLGITYFIVDMRSPGLDIRPLREMTGLEMFNEVFFDDVFVPDDCVVGEVDGGWPLARTTLANERVSMGSGSSFGGGIEQLLSLVGDQLAAGVRRRDGLLLDEVGSLVAEAHSIAVLGLRTAVRSVTGAAPGPEASVRKLLGVEHDQRAQEAGLALLGPTGATVVGPAAQWTFGFLANRCLTIAGGTSEIQRNVIGERLLGLPRDPEPPVPSVGA